MDTSKTYIKMSDHPDIQGNVQYLLNDPRKRIEYQGDNVIVELERGTTNWRTIRLLRQSQIQEMLGLELGELINGFDSFCNDVLRMYDCSDDFPNSMEQLWLAFYMHEKHGKVWDGEKWITK